MAAPTTNMYEPDRVKALKEFDDAKSGVKGLSDSGITSIPSIFVHPPHIVSGLIKSSSRTCIGIPVVDLSNLDAVPDHRPKIVKDIREAASTWGFFQVINHGIPISVLDDINSAIKAFHEQPQESKIKHYARKEQSGVTFSSNNDLYRSKAATWHDYVQVWMAPQKTELDQIPALYRNELLAWDKSAAKLTETLAELLSEGLGLHPKKLKESSLFETRIFGGMFYPYCPQPDLTVGLSDHTDPGVMTLLLKNGAPGLQVKHEGDWVDVKPLPGAVIINIGDFLEIVSNGEYRSVQHRVLANSQKEPRVSIVHWFDVGNWDESTEYGPLPELLSSSEKPARFRNFTKQDYIDNFYSKGLDSKSLVHKLRIAN